jgi:hypothetical protein
MEALILVATLGGLTMFARIGAAGSWRAIGDRFVAVPALTRSVDIKFNKRLSLRRLIDARYG